MNEPIKFSPPEFPATVEAIAEPLNIQLIIDDCRGVVVTDSTLIVNSKLESGIIQVFDNKTGELKDQFGRLGRGPGELLSPYLSMYPGDGYLNVYEKSGRVMYKYISVNGKYTLKESYKIKQTFHNVFPLNESAFIGSAPIHSRFRIVSKNDSLIFVNKTLPIFPGENDTAIVKAFCGMEFRLRPDKKRIVATNNFLCGTSFLEILKTENNTIIPDTVLRFYPPIYTIRHISERGGRRTCAVSVAPGGKLGFKDISVSNEYIYAVFNDNIWKDGDDKMPPANYIYIFKWDGTPVKSIKTPYDLNTVSVTSDNSKIFVSYIDQEGMEIFARIFL